MPYQVDIRADLDLVIVHCWGDIGQLEIETALIEIPRLKGFRPGLNMFVDFRGCTTAMGWWHVRNIAAFSRQWESVWGHSKWALAVSSDLVYGLARIYTAMSNQGDVKSRVFRDVEAARAWLKTKVDVNAILEALALKLAEDEAAPPGKQKSLS